MSRVLVSRWARLPLAIGTALLLTMALPAPAWPVVGDVVVQLGGPGVPQGLLETPRAKVTPQIGHCYTVRELFPNAPEGSYFHSVGNYSTAPIVIYGTDTCTGPPPHFEPGPLSAGETRAGVIRSFKTGPGAVPLPTMPTEFPTTRAPRPQ